MSGSWPIPQQAASRSFKLGFLTDFARSVLDAETGKLVEYQHLIKRPKYKDEQGYSFGNRVGHLAQGMPGRKNMTNIFLSTRKEYQLTDGKLSVLYDPIKKRQTTQG